MKNNILVTIFTFAVVLIVSSCNSNQTTNTESEVKKDSVVADPHAQHQVKTENDEKNQRELKYSAYADSVNQGLIPKDTLKTSARREAKGTVGSLNVVINYGSPGVKGRAIWNGLVGYDQVWVTGAHTATAVTFDKDVMINEQKINAGTYGFFTIPSATEWTLILNTRPNQHLADDYSEKEDVMRIKVKPETLKKEVQRLTYTIDKKSDTEGAISMSWEKIKVSMPFKVIM
ncbi:DUF2911 domain-containing protein [Thermoflexibacter ruber]|uniref:DUF2911 domain-containing protein n=1 Tax=Thermoflexibacter ruber TaxID=1003 RepID=A0A1I2AZJ3_9BACT|nr:DUF2911 domain-containing protein [Thermoflexibacter ruber]SFE49332.1 Protein of unknown function [Thermoflexibacter ruber]